MIIICDKCANRIQTPEKITEVLCPRCGTKMRTVKKYTLNIEIAPPLIISEERLLRMHNQIARTSKSIIEFYTKRQKDGYIA